MSISVSINQRHVQNTLRQLGRVSPEIEKRIVTRTAKAAINIEGGAKKEVTSQGAVNYGRLRSSIHQKPVDRGLSRTIGVHDDATAQVNYARAIEEGTGPHGVPLDALKLWAAHKFKISAATKVGQARINAIAIGTQIGIRKHGTRARPYLMPAYEHEVHDYLIDLRRILDDAARDIGRDSTRGGV